MSEPSVSRGFKPCRSAVDSAHGCGVAACVATISDGWRKHWLSGYVHGCCLECIPAHRRAMARLEHVISLRVVVGFCLCFNYSTWGHGTPGACYFPTVCSMRRNKKSMAYSIARRLHTAHSRRIAYTVCERLYSTGILLGHCRDMVIAL